MKILLTGSAGMVGQNIRDHPNFKDFDFLTPLKKDLNLLNFDEISIYLKEYRPDMVIHAAGKVGGIHANMSNQFEMLYENLLMSINLITASKNIKIKNFINIGSSCMYPAEIKNPLDEDSLFQGQFESTNEGFAVAKMAAMKACEIISNESMHYNFKTLIPCNLYGKYDHYDLENSHMIPSVILKVHSAKETSEKTIDIWGDGLARREYMLASDFADFIFFSLSKLDDLPSVLNVGPGVDFTINDYYSVIMKTVGYDGSVSLDLSKPTGIKQKLLDVKKMNSFGWSPKTSLEEGIKKTYKYFLDELEKD